MNILEPYIYISSFDDDNTEKIRNKISDIAISFNPDQPILVEINSLGGNAYNMLSIYEHMRTLPNPIVTYTNSVAMSAGAILLSALGTPNNRFCSPNATIMIHELQGGALGDIKDMHDQYFDVSKLNDRIMSLLAKSMGLNNREDIVKLIKDNARGNDLYFNAEQAKEFKVIDHIGYLRMQPKTSFDIITSLDESEMIAAMTELPVEEILLESKKPSKRKGKKK